MECSFSKDHLFLHTACCAVLCGAVPTTAGSELHCQEAVEDSDHASDQPVDKDEEDEASSTSSSSSEEDDKASKPSSKPSSATAFGPRHWVTGSYCTWPIQNS